MNLPAYLKPLGYIEIPFTLTRVNHIVIRGKVNGEDVVLIVDTGASPDLHCRKLRGPSGFDIRHSGTSGSKFGPAEEDQGMEQIGKPGYWFVAYDRF